MFSVLVLCLKSVMVIGFLSVIFGADINDLNDLFNVFVFAIVFSLFSLSYYKENDKIYSLVCDCMNVNLYNYNEDNEDSNNNENSDNERRRMMKMWVKWIYLLMIVITWFSSIVIPLDWDKWYQPFPIPNIIGSIFGYTIGFLIDIFLISHEKDTYNIIYKLFDLNNHDNEKDDNERNVLHYHNA